MKPSLLILPVLFVSAVCNGQEATINFNIRNNIENNIYVLNNDYSNPSVMFGERVSTLSLSDGKATYSVELARPISVFLYFKGDSAKDSRYAFYLSPGDKLNFRVDARDPDNTYNVSGKGSENNQPLIQPLSNNLFELKSDVTDTLPDNAMSRLKTSYLDYKKLLNRYIKKYKPSAEFIRNHTVISEYFPVVQFIDFKGNHKFKIFHAYKRNEDKWQSIEDSLIRQKPLNNDELLNAPSSVYFLPVYVRRLNERLLSHPELLPQYFPDGDGALTMKADPQNLPQEKIINKHFTGKTREFLYAVLLKEAVNENEDNLIEILARFKDAYPASGYLPFIEPDIKKIEERRKRTLTKDMVIVENSESFRSFDDVLTFVRGKTVLLDMWGTWCGPCRSELSINSDAIKQHFKGKDLSYLYIANHDLNNTARWKQLIPYYNLTGTHIMASKELTKDIMNKIKGNGYPTYVIIKRDGTFELSDAGFPMDRQILLKQLERALGY